MPLLINLRHLAVRTVALKGEVSAADLQMESRDAMIQIRRPLKYDLTIEKVNECVLVQGVLEMVLDCQCVRCLEPFQQTVELEGALCELPLTGEEAVPVANDSVDLTPHLRDDIFLRFPTHPLCKPECRGLTIRSSDQLHQTGAVDPGEFSPSAWDVLNKLKL